MSNYADELADLLSCLPQAPALLFRPDPPTYRWLARMRGGALA
jgi:hypothetical protein